MSKGSAAQVIAQEQELFEEYLRVRGIHPDQTAERKRKMRAKGKAARQARRRNRSK